MSTLFSPGCALMLYKPDLAKKTKDFLMDNGKISGLHMTCCHHDPKQEKGTVIINTCAGCDRRFRQLYDDVDTVTLWEVLMNDETFPFPNYEGKEMTVHDACPTRDQKRVHDAVRALLARMNITVIEPEHTREKSRCCGSTYYEQGMPLEVVYEKCRERAAELPREDVVVYCVSCPKFLNVGGKKPRYLLDLLFNEPTTMEVSELTPWMDMIEAFRNEH